MAPHQRLRDQPDAICWFSLRRVPRTVAAHVALLVPHLGCDAYPIRSGIATAIGHLLAGAFEQGGRDGADSQGAPLARMLASLISDAVHPAWSGVTLSGQAFLRFKVV